MDYDSDAAHVVCRSWKDYRVIRMQWPCCAAGSLWTAIYFPQFWWLISGTPWSKCCFLLWYLAGVDIFKYIRQLVLLVHHSSMLLSTWFETTVLFDLRFLCKQYTHTHTHTHIQVSQEECASLRKSVPYVKVYRYKPKHLYPKLNG